MLIYTNNMLLSTHVLTHLAGVMTRRVARVWDAAAADLPLDYVRELYEIRQTLAEHVEEYTQYAVPYNEFNDCKTLEEQRELLLSSLEMVVDDEATWMEGQLQRLQYQHPAYSAGAVIPKQLHAQAISIAAVAVQYLGDKCDALQELLQRQVSATDWYSLVTWRGGVLYNEELLNSTMHRVDEVMYSINSDTNITALCEQIVADSIREVISGRASTLLREVTANHLVHNNDYQTLVDRWLPLTLQQPFTQEEIIREQAAVKNLINCRLKASHRAPFL